VLCLSQSGRSFSGPLKPAGEPLTREAQAAVPIS
jgi:hypothetical protein